MKRFWKDVVVERESGGWAVRLDERQLKTPARQPLALPTQGLAQAIADEWRSVEESLDPRAMRLTGLANAAIDRVQSDRQAFVEGVANYAEADLACYRAEGPPGLVARQEEHWDPLLAWGRRSYDIEFVTTSGLMHVNQPAATAERLRHAVAALGAFHLAGLSPLITIGGSLVVALAVQEKAISPEQAWDAVTVDDRWQLEQWGADAEAKAVLENRRRDFFAAARFLELLN